MGQPFPYLSSLSPSHMVWVIGTVVMIHAMRFEKPQDVANLPLIDQIIWEQYDKIYHLALSILDDEEAAADAAQDTFVAVSRKLDQFRGDAELKTWVYAICINTCRSALRRRKARTRLRESWTRLQGLFQREPSVESAVSQNQSDGQLWQAVDQLSEKHRLPVILHYLHGFGAREIGQMLSISEGTVHSRLHYARRQLKSLLQEGQDGK